MQFSHMIPVYFSRPLQTTIFELPVRIFFSSFFAFISISSFTCFSNFCEILAVAPPTTRSCSARCFLHQRSFWTTKVTVIQCSSDRAFGKTLFPQIFRRASTNFGSLLFMVGFAVLIILQCRSIYSFQFFSSLPSKPPVSFGRGLTPVVSKRHRELLLEALFSLFFLLLIFFSLQLNVRPFWLGTDCVFYSSSAL